MHRHFFKLFIAVFFLLGCGSHTPSVEENNVVKLAKLLHTLTPHLTSSETKQLSRDIFSQTAKLTKEFEMTSPPQYHNFLVNIGMKEKGLCYHWSDALYAYFVKQNYPSFEFHLVGANIGEYWSEHNSLVVVAKGMSIEDGVIVDPWRKGGKLYFSKLKEDTKYIWKHRDKRGCRRFYSTTGSSPTPDSLSSAASASSASF
jgi:hypothetical protein